MDDDGSNNSNNNVLSHQKQEEEEPLPLPLPQITILLTPEGQRVRSILYTKPEELPLYFINDINELMNDIAAVGDFLPKVRTLIVDDLFVRDEQHRQEHNDDRNSSNNNNERAHQQDDDEEELPQPRIVLLTPVGQNVRSVLAKKPEDLPPCIINQINEALNDIATGGDFLTKVRTSIVDDLCMCEEQHRQEQQQQKRGLTKTIIHNDWKKIERQYETAIRFFPDVLTEIFDGDYYPIQWMPLHSKDSDYNWRLVSLIPLIVKLGIELQQFDEVERGGLLTRMDNGYNALQYIILYVRTEITTNTTDECYSTVVERLREENLFIKEDIQQYNLFGELCSSDVGSFLASRVQYIIDWDPVTLSMPCEPENGDGLPIHWSSDEDSSLQEFSTMLKAGMKYFPEKFGFVFGESTQQQYDGKIVQGTPFQQACKTHGREKVINEVINCIKEYCFASTSAGTNNNNNIEISLLMSAITDKSIHIDCLYLLLRNDISTGLLRLQQHLHQHQQLEEGNRQTVAKINTDNDNIHVSNNKEIIVDSTTTSTSSSSFLNVAAIAAAAATRTRTVSSPTTNKNKKNMSSASNNNDNNDTNNDALSSISTTGTLAAAATAIIVVPSTTMNHNNNNDDDNNNHHHTVTQYQPSSSSSSSSSSSVNRKKRKQHEM